MNFLRGRILIALAGQEADVPLIRYAAMLARLQAAPSVATERHAAALSQTAERGRADSGVAVASAESGWSDHFPEVRFVHVRHRAGTGSLRRFRSQLREQVERWFPALPQRVPVGCDILSGCAEERLASFAADFDSDLLLVGQALCPPAACGRLAVAAPCPVWAVPSHWPPIVRRILMPLGLCERHLVSLRTAQLLARMIPHAKVVALHVHREGVTLTDEALYQQVQHRKQMEFESFLARVGAFDAAIVPHVAVGLRVPEVIASVAYQQSVDLVVLSARGRSCLASWLQPSQTEQTIRMTPTSILIARGKDSRLGAIRALTEKLRTADEIRFG